MIDKSEQTIKRRGLARAGVSAALVLAALVASSAILPSHAAGQGEQDGQALFQKRCTVKTFKYSASLQNAGFTWNEAKLDKWLTDTESLVPDNDMSFRVPKQEERAAIISYLKTLSIP
jgi:cytochrome c2